MTSKSEGTDNVRDASGNLIDSYRVCYGKRHVIQSFSDHPAVDTPSHPAEWKGESLESLGPRYKNDWSTAAGRYQITRPTWLGCQGILRLNNFGPEAQDDSAILLIKQKGALDLVNQGDIASAIAACHGVWASFPGSTAGQPTSTFVAMVLAFTGAGGVCA
jgi:lysozyme